MADFVAVIRRAVDGLANNTPEMRAKVYDKARGAVQRQLENMKPRPPEDMLRRQMEKLEAAIVDVENEHAEALEPLAEETAAAPLVEEASAPAYAEEHAPEPEADRVEEPVAEPVPAPIAAEPADSREEGPLVGEVHHEEPAAAAVPEAAEFHAEPEVPEQVAAEPTIAEQPVVPPQAEEPARQHYGDWRDDLPPEDNIPDGFDRQVEPVPAETASGTVLHESEEYFPPQEERSVEEERPVFESAEPRAASAAHAEPEPAVTESAPPEPWMEPAPAEPRSDEQAEDVFSYTPHVEQRVTPPAPEFAGWESEPAAAEPPSAAVPLTEPAKPTEEDWGWETPAPAPAAPASPVAQQPDVSAAWDDVPELLPAGPVEPVDQRAQMAAADAHFDPQTHVSADSVRMPSVSDLPDLSAPRAATAGAGVLDPDPFADFVEQKPATVTASKPADSDPWGDLEELIGFNKDTATSGGSSRALHTDSDADDLMSAPARPYRVTPVRKRNYAGILLAIVGLALIGGGGYAMWLNRDSLNDMVDGLIQSSLSGSQTAEQTPSGAPANPVPAPSSPAPSNSPPANSSAASPPAGQSTPAAPAPSQQANSNPNANTAAPAAASADGSIAGSKFTQRLMADGSETDEGPGGAGGLAQNAEGQSVAQLNAPSGQPAPAAQAPAANAPTGAAAAPDAAAPGPSAPSATPAEAPALAGEKMFLYEERIGQTAPTAIDGAVSWSLQREPGANGRQEPVVQGRINIPGRGLTALLTFKRNSDPSLPASHLIEIVFAVPPDFEGGAIDSVQRIAMKSTEQDRGNALIAVPAKITDDFHMIALNDFPDARNTNLELLRTRNWIDIPVAYRNGRRALLTLQKGPEGERAFNDAIREWSSLGATASGQ